MSESSLYSALDQNLQLGNPNFLKYIYTQSLKSTQRSLTKWTTTARNFEEHHNRWLQGKMLQMNGTTRLETGRSELPQMTVP